MFGASQAMFSCNGKPSVPDRARIRPGLLYIILLTAILAAVVIIRPYQWMNDDSYFYLKVALNHSRGLGCSFSGLAPTNGYHPLWQWLLCALFDLTKPSVMAGLIQARLLSLAMMAGALLSLHGFVKQAFNAPWAAASVAVMSLFATRGVACMEFWLYAAALASLMCFGLRCTTRFRDALLAGLLATIVVFARLDGVVVVAACWVIGLAIRFFNSPDGRERLRYAVLSTFIIVIFVVLYAAFNHRMYGHVASISALLKSSFPTPRLLTREQLFSTAHAWPGVFGGLLYLGWFARTRPKDRANVLLAAIALAGILHLLLIALFTRWAAFGIWWWTLSYLTFSLLVGFVGRRLFSSRWAAVIVIVVASWQALVIGDVLIRYPDRPQGVMGREYASHIPPDAVVFQIDATGMTSYLADRVVINGDGLMNNMEYQEAVSGGRLPEYFSKYGVTHVVHDEAEDLSDDVLSGRYFTAAISVPCHLYGRESVLRLPREWEAARWSVVWPGREIPWPRGGYVQTFVVWRLPQDRDEWLRMTDRQPPSAQ